MRLRPRTCCWVTLIAAVLSFCALATLQAATAGGTIVLGFEGEPATLDPAAGTNLATLRVTRLILENLVTEDVAKTGVTAPPLVPGLAERWDISADGLVYTFHLRSGVRFHDGEPFDSNAVKFNFDRNMNPTSPQFFPAGNTTLNQVYGRIERTQAVDSRTFRIVLKEPFGSFLRLLAHPNCGILSPKALIKCGNDNIGNNPVGTGPFRFVSRERGVKIVLDRNASYWGTPAKLSTVIIRPIPEPGARMAALKTGEIDMDLCVLPDMVQQVKADPSLQLEMPAPPHVWYVLLNTKGTPTASKLVRQALNHAVDMDAIVDTLYPGKSAVVLNGLFPLGNPAYDPSLPKQYSYDPNKARRLLAEAGYPKGFEMTLAFPTSGVSFMQATQMSEMIQAYLADVGVRVKLEPVEYRAYLSLIRPGMAEGISAFVIGWQSIAADPYVIEQLFGTAYQPPNGNNQGWYSKPALDALMRKARIEPDEERRIALYRQAEAELLQDAPAILAVQDKFPKAWSKRVKGMTMGSSPYFDLTKATFE